MVVDIFQYSEKKLPSTLTELYQLFIVMTLKRQVKKEYVAKKPLCSSVAVTAAGDSVEESALCVMLRGIPKETVGIVVFQWRSQPNSDARAQNFYSQRNYMYV